MKCEVGVSGDKAKQSQVMNSLLYAMPSSLDALAQSQAGRLQPMNSIESTTCFCKSSFIRVRPSSFIMYHVQLLSIRNSRGEELQQTPWLTKPKVSALSLQGKFGDSWLRATVEPLKEFK